MEIGLIIFVILGLILVYILIRFSTSLTQKKRALPFKRKDFLLSIPERKFLEQLEKIVPAGYKIFPQILLSKIVNVDTSQNDFWKYFNKINKKTIDFVIFEKPYFKPILAIEYDGKTHTRKDRRDRDSFVNQVLAIVGIKTLHISHGEKTSMAEVKCKILEMLEG